MISRSPSTKGQRYFHVLPPFHHNPSHEHRKSRFSFQPRQHKIIPKSLFSASPLQKTPPKKTCLHKHHHVHVLLHFSCQNHHDVHCFMSFRLACRVKPSTPSLRLAFVSLSIYQIPTHTHFVKLMRRYEHTCANTDKNKPIDTQPNRYTR